MTVVAVSILTATTLLPVLIAMLGDRVMPGGIVARVVLGDLQAQAVPGARAAAAAPRGPAFWERWTTRGHGPALDGGDRRQRGAADPGDPAALDRDRHRGARPVPQGQRRAGRQRTRPEAARRRHRPGPDRRLLRRARPIAPRSRPSSANWPARPGVASVAPPAYAAESVLFQATPSAPSESDADHRPGRSPARHGRPRRRAQRGRDRRRRRRNRSQPGRPHRRSAARCGRSSSSSSRSASSS